MPIGSRVPKSKIDEDELAIKIGVDNPQIVPVGTEIFGTDFTSQEMVMAYACGIHNHDIINFIAEVRELCFRSKIEYSPDELTAYISKKKER